jgi:LPS sulfotransferase NodH
MILIEQARWRGYFAVNALQPLTIIYEDLVSAPQAAVDAVRQLVGLEDGLAIDPAAIDLVIQRDEASAAWRARFLAETADLTIPTTLS